MVVAPRTHLSSDLVTPWGSETGCGLSERVLSALGEVDLSIAEESVVVFCCGRSRFVTTERDED